jgi:hypothetical protein
LSVEVDIDDIIKEVSQTQQEHLSTFYFKFLVRGKASKKSSSKIFLLAGKQLLNEHYRTRF